jgi:5-methylthioadenosine/S-adenosylhomocysteine deaminase
MRDGELLTIRVDHLLKEASATAEKIDQFLVQREGDIRSKLLAIGELQQEESFEIQVKAQLGDPERLERLLQDPEIKIVQRSHYRQHDTYFEFGPPLNSRVRYREDDTFDSSGAVTNVRTRLTLTETGEQREFTSALLLSRSRYISPATRTLRFYREYFQADSERTVIKERRRWHIDFRSMRLYFNLDRLLEPAHADYFLEIKSRTWSLKDAENKANAIHDLLTQLGIDYSAIIMEEYVSLAAKPQAR